MTYLLAHSGIAGKRAKLFTHLALLGMFVSLVPFAGISSVQAQGSLTFAAVADARVLASSPDTNEGALTRLDVDNPGQESYIRFTVSGVSDAIQSATLRLFATNGSSDGPSLYLTDNTWTETGITWNNRPAPTSGAVANVATVTANTWTEYNVTAAVTGNGTYSFVLLPDSTNGVTFYSREGSSPPQLVLTVASGPTATATNTPTFGPTATSTSTFTPTFTPLPTNTPTNTPTASGGGTSFQSPAGNAVDSGGDGNGFQTNPLDAYTDNAAFAVDTNSGSGTSTSCTSAAKDKHRFYDYNFSLPGGTIINGIEVRLDAQVDGTGGTPRMCVQLSWDGGLTWTAPQTTATLTTTESTFLLGGPTNTWGRAWSLSDLSNASFRLRVINIASSTSRDFSLDWVAVKVYHSSGSSPSSTPTNTAIPPTNTPTPTASSTPTPTSTIGPSPTSTNTALPTSAPTTSPSFTPTSTRTATSTPQNTYTPTNTSVSSVITLAAVADARVLEINPDINYGTLPQLDIDNPGEQSYIRFTVNGATGVIQSAVLRLFVTNGSTNGPSIYGTDNAWTEAGITWNNRLAATTGAIANLGAATASTWVEYNLTSYITGNGTYNFVFLPDSSDGIRFVSREGTTPPQLVLTFATGPTSTPTNTGTPTNTATPGPSPTSTHTATPTQTPSSESVIFVGAGDIAECGGHAEDTAQLLDNIPGTVYTLGDNAYPNGTAAQFNDCYNPTWGRHKVRTRPAVGDNDYNTSGAVPYYNYFGAAAGNPNQGYYSFDLGSWHIIVLNSNCSDAGGCGSSSPQVQWLQADLAANPSACILAIHHEPLFSSKGGDSTMRNFWAPLYAAGADIVLSGHRHMYERFAPQNPDGVADLSNGIRQFVVGTGGAGLTSAPSSSSPNSQIRNNNTFGVLKLTLHPTSYDWQFIPIAGQTFIDSGSAPCVTP